jgi:hypothetical protein
MAWENGIMDLGQLASSGDMSSKQYRIVVASTANAADSVTVVAARGGNLTGVWQDNSTVATAGALRVLGVSKVAAGDSSGGSAITIGAKVVASSQGQAVLSTAAGQHVLGIAMGPLGASSTGVIPVMLTIGAIST